LIFKGQNQRHCFCR